METEFLCAMKSLCLDARALLGVFVMALLIPAVLAYVGSWVLGRGSRGRWSQRLRKVALVLGASALVLLAIYLITPFALSVLTSSQTEGWTCHPQSYEPDYYLPYDPNCTGEGINCTSIMYGAVP